MAHAINWLLILTFFTPSAVLVSGCAMTTKPDDQATACTETDWFSLGRELGLNGTKLTPEFKHEGCLPNRDQDLELSVGYQQGLSEFCLPENGYRMGKQGKESIDYCPLQVREEFQKAHQLGMEVFKLEREQEFLSSQLKSIFERTQAQKLSDIEKSSLKDQIADLESQKQRLTRRIEEVRIKGNRFL